MYVPTFSYVIEYIELVANMFLRNYKQIYISCRRIFGTCCILSCNQVGASSTNFQFGVRNVRLALNNT